MYKRIFSVVISIIMIMTIITPINVTAFASDKVVNEELFHVTVKSVPEYSGQEIEPEVEVTYDKLLLKENEDYKISFSNNIEAGCKAEINVVGINEYTGINLSRNFLIARRDVSNLTVETSNARYLGCPVGPYEVKVTDNGAAVEEGKDYIIKYRNNTKAGDRAWVRIIGIGNYIGLDETYFSIVEDLDYVTASEIDIIDDGINGLTPEDCREGLLIKKGSTATINIPQSCEQGFKSLTVYREGRTKDIVEEYTPTFSKVLDKQGIWTVICEYEELGQTITSGFIYEVISEDAKEQYTEKNVLKMMPPVDASDRMIVMDYTGEYRCEDHDATEWYTSKGGNISMAYRGVLYLYEPGVTKAHLYYPNQESLIWELETEALDLTKKGEIVNFDVESSAAVVRFDDEIIRPEKDYTVNFKRIDDYIKVQVTGTGLYSGTLEAYFYADTGYPYVKRIEDDKISVSVLEAPVYTGKTLEPKVAVTYRNKLLEEGTDYELSYKNNKNVGDDAVVTATGKGVYEGMAESKNFTIQKIDISQKYWAYAQDRNYIGIPLKPFSYGLEGGSGEFEIEYYEQFFNNTDVGTAQIRFIGKNNFKGIINKNFEIKAVEPGSSETRDIDIIADGKRGEIQDSIKSAGLGTYVYVNADSEDVYNLNADDIVLKVYLNGKLVDEEEVYGGFTNFLVKMDKPGVWDIKLVYLTEYIVFQGYKTDPVTGKTKYVVETAIESRHRRCAYEVQSPEPVTDCSLSPVAEPYTPDNHTRVFDFTGDFDVNDMGPVEWSVSDKSIGEIDKGILNLKSSGALKVTAEYRGKVFEWYLENKPHNIKTKGNVLTYDPVNENALIGYEDEILEKDIDYDVITEEYNDSLVKVTFKGKGIYSGSITGLYYKDTGYPYVKSAEALSLDKSSVELNLKDNTEVQLSAAIEPDFTSEKNIEWSSENPAIAAVDAKGKVTAQSGGRTVITARSEDGLSDSCEVFVNVPLENLSLNVTNKQMARGSSFTLEPVLEPADSTDELNITWTSSDESVATVDKNGVVTATGKGTAEITAETANGFKAKCDISVNVPIEKIVTGNRNIQLDPGQEFKLEAEVFPEDTTENKKITWSIPSYDSYYRNIATVDQNGVVKANNPGSTTVTASAANGRVTAYYTIYVHTPIEDLYLDTYESEVMEGEQLQIEAYIDPYYTTHDKTIRWESSNSDVATVDNYGRVTGVSPGKTTITATTVNGIKDSIEIEVTFDPRKAKAVLTEDIYTYTGSYIRPEIEVYDSAGNKLTEDYYYIDYDYDEYPGIKTVYVQIYNDYYDYKEVYLNYVIVPKAPSNVSAVLSTASGGYDDVKFSWNKATGASGYTVYYKESTASEYRYLKRTTSTSVTEKNLKDGVKYNFKVVPYYKSGDTRYASLQYKTASVYTLKKLSTPTVTKSGTKVKVKWKNINGESGYQISKSTKKTGTSIVSTYATTSGTSKLVSATKGKTYYYKVRAYKNVKVNGVTKKVYGPWSTVKSYKRK